MDIQRLDNACDGRLAPTSLLLFHNLVPSPQIHESSEDHDYNTTASSCLDHSVEGSCVQVDIVRH